MNLDENHRIVVLLADGIRNYMTKHLSKDWMIENKFISLDEYNDDKHPLANRRFEEMGLKPIEYFNPTLSIGSAITLLGNGKINALPIIDDNTL